MPPASPFQPLLQNIVLTCYDDVMYAVLESIRLMKICVRGYGAEAVVEIRLFRGGPKAEMGRRKPGKGVDSGGEVHISRGRRNGQRLIYCLCRIAASVMPISLHCHR